MAAEASPSTSFFTAEVAVQTWPAHAVCSAVGAAAVLEADGGVVEDVPDEVGADAVVDPEHAVTRATATVATAAAAIDLLIMRSPPSSLRWSSSGNSGTGSTRCHWSGEGAHVIFPGDRHNDSDVC
jgi:hypothetical protein